MKTDLPYNSYNIYTSQIWEYERNAYMRSGSQENWNEIEELYDLLQEYILAAGAEPFLKNTDITDDNHYLIDFRNHFAEKTALDFFICKGDLYDMQEPCLIKYKGTVRTDFEKLLMLKLRQYKDKLHEVKSFLQYQLKQNFKNKLDELADFLHLSFLQHPALLDERIVSLTIAWLNAQKEQTANAPKRRSKKAGQKNTYVDATVIYEDTVVVEALPAHEENEVLIKEDSAEDANLSPVNEEERASESVIGDLDGKKDDKLPGIKADEKTEDAIPEGYTQVAGDFSKEETQVYFSFLYKETDESGKPFLAEAEVREIFKYGLAIPSNPPKKRYGLHYSLKFPKSIVEYCIYRFFYKHTTSHHKKSVLKFFASYLQDFEKSLKSEKAMQTWSDNVVGTKPSRMKFALADYLPERMRVSTSHPEPQYFKGS